jgi:hypothetical protein
VADLRDVPLAVLDRLGHRGTLRETAGDGAGLVLPHKRLAAQRVRLRPITPDESG